MTKVFLKAGRDKLARNHHPWVYSGAVERLEGRPEAGAIVEVVREDGAFLAWAQFNPTSKIRLRLMEWDPKVPVDEAWYRRTLTRAVASRRGLFDRTTACRLVFAESDFLPGLIVDKMGDWLVAQFLTAGADREKPLFARLLRELFPDCRGLLERSDGDGRRMEGLPEAQGLLWGKEPPADWTILENGLRFGLDTSGQKTGFYTDQRENRQLFAPYCANTEVLDAFSYSGAFGMYASQAGATAVTLLDASSEALARAKANFALNNFAAPECLEGDAFEVLRQLKKAGRRFGAVSLDPPKLASSRDHLDRALKGYKDLNLQALSLVQPGGVLATFSCSGAVTAEAFREMFAFAAKDAGREVQILHQLHQASCHPIRVSMPEGEYLKGLLVRVVS